MSDRGMESNNNSSKPPGSYLIHCPCWSLETTTNKASSYSSWQGFCIAEMPSEIRFRWNTGWRETGRTGISSVFKTFSQTVHVTMIDLECYQQYAKKQTNKHLCNVTSHLISKCFFVFFVSDRDSKCLAEDYHNGPFLFFSLSCNYQLQLSLSQWQNWWVEYVEKYVSTSQRRKHLRGTPQWMRIWSMLIKQCHDLLPVTFTALIPKAWLPGKCIIWSQLS